MLKLFLKYQLRNKQAFAFPIILLTFFFIRVSNGGKGNFNLSVFGPIYIPTLFTNLIVFSKVPIPLYYITNASMVRVVRAINLTTLCWINIVCLAMNLYCSIALHQPLLSSLQYFIITNISVFIAFMAGNRISFSDLYTMKSTSWASFGMNFLFVIVIAIPCTGLLLLMHWFPVVCNYVIILLLPLLIILWWTDSKSYKEITHFSHLLSLNDNDKKRKKIFR